MITCPNTSCSIASPRLTLTNRITHVHKSITCLLILIDTLVMYWVRLQRVRESEGQVADFILQSFTGKQVFTHGRWQIGLIKFLTSCYGVLWSRIVATVLCLCCDTANIHLKLGCGSWSNSILTTCLRFSRNFFALTLVIRISTSSRGNYLLLHGTSTVVSIIRFHICNSSFNWWYDVLFNVINTSNPLSVLVF